MNIAIEKQLVRAPLASAQHFIDAFLREHPAPNGFGSLIDLRAGGAEKTATVRIHPEHRPGDMTPRFAVRWEATGGGPYPVFEGVINVLADEDYNTFYLTLEGGYQAPGGLAGAAFDAVIGQHVAVAAARGLLQQIGAGVEAQFATAERSKTA